MISLFWPFIDKEVALANLSKTFDTRWLGQGEQVEEFENLFGTYVGEERVVATNSGTASLHLAYILADIKEGDEVISPALTCTATNHALLYQKAKIVFADVQPGTLNIDPADIERKITKKTKAIVVVHLGGIPCDMDSIMRIAKEYNLKVIEDCAQALGAEYKGKKVGTIGDYGCFSLQAIKHITTGDGGFLVVNTTQEDYKRAKRLRWFGIDREKKIKNDWQPMNQREIVSDQTEVGYKYQMTDIDAAIGKAQLPHLTMLINRRRRLANLYRYELQEYVRMQPQIAGSSNWLFTIFVPDRDEFQQHMKEQGVETNMVQVDNRLVSVFKPFATECTTLDREHGQYVSLPLHHKLSEEDILYICDKIKQYYAGSKLWREVAESFKPQSGE